MSNAYGIYTGTTDIYYAKMSTADATNTAPVYGQVKTLGKSVSFSVTPTYKEGEKYASNTAVRRIKKIDKYEVSISCDHIDADTLADILGRTLGTDKVQLVKGTDNQPYVALGFGITKDDNTRELWWLYKGKVQQNEVAGETESGDIAFQDIKLEGIFDRRIDNDAIAAIADTAVATTITESGWFSAVYMGPAAAQQSGGSEG